MTNDRGKETEVTWTRDGSAVTFSYNENVSLYTIRHFDEKAAKVVEKDKIVLVKQISRETMQIVTKE